MASLTSVPGSVLSVINAVMSRELTVVDDVKNSHYEQENTGRVYYFQAYQVGEKDDNH